MVDGSGLGATPLTAALAGPATALAGAPGENLLIGAADRVYARSVAGIRQIAVAGSPAYPG